MQVWLAGNVTDPAPGEFAFRVISWEVIGVFESRNLAVASCYDETCFVAPFEMNAAGPRETTVMMLCEYPLSEPTQADEAEVNEQPTTD